MPDSRGESFLARWSRRKQAEPETREREDTRVAEARGDPPATPAVAEPAALPPDLPPIETLTPESDFTRFMRPDVPRQSRNAALKTLFTDPHFNVMDGLDIYIDDYTKPDPIPLEMLKDLAQSRLLGLFDEEEKEDEVGAPEGASAGVPPADAPGAPAADARLECPPGEAPVPTGGLSIGDAPTPPAVTPPAD